MIWAPAAILILLGLRVWGMDEIAHALPAPYGTIVARAIAVAFVISLFLLVDQIVRRFYWHGYVRRRTGREPPALMRDIVTFALILMGISIGLSVEAGLSVTSLVTASGATAIILGIALQAVIQDLFSGLAINLDGSYAIGDYLTVYSEAMREPVYGSVVGITWRTTFLALDDGRRLMIPNHHFTTNPVMNHSRPRGAKRLSVEIELDNRVPHERVLEMFLGEAFRATRHPGLTRNPGPDVVMSGFDKDKAVYEIRFYHHPELIEPGTARSHVRRALLEVVQKNRLPMPVTQVEMIQTPDADFVFDDDDVREAIRRADLFRDALDAELTEVMFEHSIQLELGAGTVLMVQGAEPASMFIILEGAVSVSLLGPEGSQHEVAILATGNVVGEMSLMTGAPRSATVTALTRVRVLEIPKHAIEAILSRSPDLAERFSRALALRQQQNLDTVARASQREAVENDFLSRIKVFFSRALGSGDE